MSEEQNNENQNIVVKVLKSRSLERGLRTLGGMVLAAFGPQIPVLLDLVTATIPPAQSVWIGPLISLILKDVRMRVNPDSVLGKIFKYFPA